MDNLNLFPILPELFLAIVAMILLVLGVFRGNDATRFISWASVGALTIAMLMLGAQDAGSSVSILNDMFLQDRFTLFVKFWVIVGLVMSIALSVQAIDQDKIAKFEFPVLMLFAGIGMLLMVSASDMLSLYMGLELQSLSLYVLAAIRRNHVASAESGLKYFVLGAISSGMLLFGISLVYGFTGTTNFALIGETLSSGLSLGAALGLVFILAGLAFKISAVPFHMWTPDVYEGAPTPVTAFFAIVPKLAALALLARVLFVTFEPFQEQWTQILWILSVATMVVSTFAALRQESIKRLLAYSSIGNMGYVLIGFVAGGEQGLAAVLVYMPIYMIMTAGVFGVVMCMRRDDLALENISDLAGMSKHHPVLAYVMAALMFSMSGIPPLAGFFGKLIIFQAAVASGQLVLAVIGVLVSVVAAYYYLRIIKTMFFEEGIGQFEGGMELSRKLIIGLSLLFVMLFIFNPSPLVEAARAAAHSLF
ncbi:MAG: NADH-quinone oxidoreductase subunit NuoN [Alphaproteobacteria bacterium]|nr:NADH-quinone oxidoreductase subunit NuoN [Alphaproteobacteria bacterium]